MDDLCPWVDRVIGADASPDAEIADHVASCPHCSAERQAHEALIGAFRGIARPEPGPHFRSQLMARVANQRRRDRIARRRLLAMRVYWFAAAAVCAAVLVNLNWSTSTAMQNAIVLLAVAAFGVPVAAMLVVFRTDPFELILQTVTGVRGNGPSASSPAQLTAEADGLG